MLPIEAPREMALSPTKLPALWGHFPRSNRLFPTQTADLTAMSEGQDAAAAAAAAFLGVAPSEAKAGGGGNKKKKKGRKGGGAEKVHSPKLP
eukprot:scaffold7814_cov296-Pinguiococcus_pyrenoidosus.AAC.4